MPAEELHGTGDAHRAHLHEMQHVSCNDRGLAATSGFARAEESDAERLGAVEAVCQRCFATQLPCSC
jgi:hypothetical protein